MFKKITIRIVSAVILLSAVSCKKWLDLKPTDGITGAAYWQTKEQVQASVTGCYASLLGSPNGSRSLAELLFLWGELRADMLATTTFTVGEELDIMNVNILPTNSITNWRSVYQTINYCNTVIDFAPQVLAKDPTFTQDMLNRSVAEAKGLRALMYFYLVRSFGDVPLKIKATSSDQDIEQIPKAKKDSVLTQIVKDLNEAEPNVVTSFGDRASDKGRLTKYSINAIQADVYLWMERYADCITACNKIINSNQFGLIDGTNATNWFNTLYVNGNSNESIFEFQFDNQRQNTFFPLLASPSRHLVSNPLVLTDYFSVDFVNPLNVDIRGDGASARSTDNMIWKYSGLSNDNRTQRASTQYSAHWSVYRFADILLIKAEATNQLGNGQEALDLITRIRTRATALAVTNPNPSPSDKDGVADFILQERSREFAYEGKRWYDLLRNAKRNNYQRLNILLQMVANTVPPDRQQSAIAKFRDPNSHYFPIYFYELQTDRLLEQNPFYR
jgi:starch-binding outer membrane protein, SusD/RagB family